MADKNGVRLVDEEEDDLDVAVVIDPARKSKLQPALKPPANPTTGTNGTNGTNGTRNASKNAKPNGTPNGTSNGTPNGTMIPTTNAAAVAAPKQAESAPSPEAPALESPVNDQVLRDEVNFIQNVSQFYNAEALSDVVLKVGEARYNSHRFVLAKSSEYFRTMLYEHGWQQTGPRAEVELEETPECAAVFDKFLRYLYTAEISISTMSAVGILCLADKYFVASLKELCCQYMVENSRSPKVRNALTWYSWAKALHLEPLIHQCSRTISWNFHEIISSAEFVGMDVEFLVDMFSKDSLVIPNEHSLWVAISKWLLHDSRRARLAEHIRRILPLLRFPQMNVTQLYSLEQSDLAQQPEVKSLLHSLLSQAYRFRALCPAQASLGVSFLESFYQPRDFTDLSVDTVRINNSLRFGIQVDVKTFRGAVPSEVRDGDWKITYRKQAESWSLQIYCHETAMINGEARVATSIIVYNEDEKVIQVIEEPPRTWTRGTTVTMNTALEQPHAAKNLSVLLKPVAS